MNRQELIDAEAAGIAGSKTAASDMVNAVLGIITQALADGGSVQLVGFGSFSVVHRAARTGRISSTGAEIHIPAAKTVKYAAGKALKEAVNAS